MGDYILDNTDSKKDKETEPRRDDSWTSRRSLLKIAAGAAGTVVIGGVLYTLLGTQNKALIATPTPVPVTPTPTPAPIAVTVLEARSIPKYVEQLVIPPVHTPNAAGVYEIDADQFTEQILPRVDATGKSTGFGPTTVWGYGGLIKDPATGSFVYFHNSPASTFEATRGVPVKVKWQNKLTMPHPLPIDPTIDWANPNNLPMNMGSMATAFPPGMADVQKSVPIVPHLHGGEIPSQFDGGPSAWFTADGKTGRDFTSKEYTYPNSQLPGTIWYHDHAMGMTRLNVYMGLAGFYLIRDPNDPVASLLPQGKYEIPIAIQDRQFYTTDGAGNNELYYPSVGLNPKVHPYWNPETFGDIIMVNGKTWPNLNVDQGQYRFRLLNGSTARFYHLRFSNGMSFTQIGSDGSYLKSAVTINDLQIAPGERADILVDFTNFAPGTKLVLLNDANGPYPDGDPVDFETTGQIMQFTVSDNPGFTPQALPAIINDTLKGESFPTLGKPSVTRLLYLVEIMGENGPVMVTIDGQHFMSPVTELPKVGAIEDWVVVNLTADTHPIHLHLVQFQLVNRQKFDAEKCLEKWMKANKEGLDSMGMLPLTKPTVRISPEEFYEERPEGPKPNEMVWKDTLQMNPGEVTTIRVRFSPTDGSPDFPFDATSGPGYVWHCHIIDHEDNDMMRPFKVVKPYNNSAL